MQVVYSVNAVPIRLTEERWVHIVENHNDLAGLFDDVLSTVEAPDFIISGYRGALIAVREVKEGYCLCVVYKELAENDGFIITAYKSSKIKKEAIVWQKKP